MNYDGFIKPPLFITTHPFFRSIEQGCWSIEYDDYINSFNDSFDDGIIPFQNPDWMNPTIWSFDRLMVIRDEALLHESIPMSFTDAVGELLYNIAESFPNLFSGDYEYLINESTVDEVPEDEFPEDEFPDIIFDDEVVVDSEDYSLARSCEELLDIIAQPFESVEDDLRSYYVEALNEYLLNEDCVANQSNANQVALAIDKCTLWMHSAPNTFYIFEFGGGVEDVTAYVHTIPSSIIPLPIRKAIVTNRYVYVLGFDAEGLSAGQYSFLFVSMGFTLSDAIANLNYILENTDVATWDEPNDPLAEYDDDEDVDSYELEDELQGDYDCPTCEDCPDMVDVGGVINTPYGELSVKGTHNIKTGITKFSPIKNRRTNVLGRSKKNIITGLKKTR